MSEGAPNPPEKNLQPQARPAPLEHESQTKPRHKWVDREKGFQITIVCRVGVEEIVLSHDSLTIRDVEEVNHRYQVPPVVQDEFAGDAQIQHVYAGKPRDSGWLKDDSLASLVQPLTDGRICCCVSAKNLHWLDWQACVVLEVDAGSNFQGQFIAAVHLENVCRV